MARNSLKNVVRLIKANDVPVEQSFLTDLERSIELQNEKESRQPSQTYKPSSMQCIRNMYYQVTGAEQDTGETKYTLIGICNSGTDIHARIQQAVIDMQSNGMECEYVNVADFVRNRGLKESLEIRKEPDFEHGDYETKLYHKDLNISFLCDGIIKYKGTYYLLELKTESSGKFMMRKGVDKKHYDQGTAYSLIFRIDKVIFVYINRDVLDMKAYMFEPTLEMKNAIIDRINECNAYVEHGQTPPKPDMDNRVCTYCAYRARCMSEE